MDENDIAYALRRSFGDDPLPETTGDVILLGNSARLNVGHLARVMAARTIRHYTSHTYDNG